LDAVVSPVLGCDTLTVARATGSEAGHSSSEHLTPHLLAAYLEALKPIWPRDTALKTNAANFDVLHPEAVRIINEGDGGETSFRAGDRLSREIMAFSTSDEHTPPQGGSDPHLKEGGEVLTQAKNGNGEAKGAVPQEHSPSGDMGPVSPMSTPDQLSQGQTGNPVKPTAAPRRPEAAGPAVARPDEVITTLFNMLTNVNKRLEAMESKSAAQATVWRSNSCWEHHRKHTLPRALSGGWHDRRCPGILPPRSFSAGSSLFLL
jgi:hypothetical protein